MGGDHAPAEPVAGGVAASRQGVDVVLVGDEEIVRAELERLDAPDVPVAHAPDTIGMGDDPTRAIREKPGSSVATCARLVREGGAAGFVSAGSTGAAMASAAVIVGRVKGVLRPTIASVFPTPGSPTVVLDSGANPEVKPEHLVQFAEMGAVMSEVYFGLTEPRVGLLNNGQEETKGRALERAAHELLRSAPVNFVGNVEGRVLAVDDVDVIVTDGFTGNIFLKTTEGAAAFVSGLFLEALAGLDEDLRGRLLPLLAPILERVDYEHHGGAHLLGIDGVVVIAHGSSSRRAIANALRMASDGADRGLVRRVTERIAAG
jgi:glycerol-3-phosphate acyltransferase PlsX